MLYVYGVYELTLFFLSCNTKISTECLAHNYFSIWFFRNLTQRQRELIEEFAKEEQGEYEKQRAASGSG